MSRPRFLIDECLSTELAGLAWTRDYEASHVRDRGLLGAKDWQLVALALAESWCLVTRNARDFRGTDPGGGPAGEYAGIELHPGLVCLHGDDRFDVDRQLYAFGVALDEITALPGGDPTNLLIEVTWQRDVDGGMLVELFDLPSDR